MHMRKGATFAVQGNSLVSTAVVDAVADTFQASEGSVRTLADRMIEALTAGHKLGGDGRHGETQSAAVVVADPRPGRSRRSCTPSRWRRRSRSPGASSTRGGRRCACSRSA